MDNDTCAGCDHDADSHFALGCSLCGCYWFESMAEIEAEADALLAEWEREIARRAVEE